MKIMNKLVAILANCVMLYECLKYVYWGGKFEECLLWVLLNGFVLIGSEIRSQDE